jgi:hypothetical protein
MRLRPFAAALALLVTAAFPAAAQYTLYYGNFHSHCNLSDDAAGALSGPPATAVQHARDVANIDILALTDHTHYMSTTEYAQLQSAADAWTTNGTFVAIAAQEHGSLSTSEAGAFGHINIWESATLINQSQYRYNLFGTYAWIASNVDDTIGAPLVASFNHPYNGSGEGIWDQFREFEYNATGNMGIKFIEVINGKRTASYEYEYFKALGNGWKLGALGSSGQSRGRLGRPTEQRRQDPAHGHLGAGAPRRPTSWARSPPAARTDGSESHHGPHPAPVHFREATGWARRSRPRRTRSTSRRSRPRRRISDRCSYSGTACSSNRSEAARPPSRGTRSTRPGPATSGTS